MSELKAIRSGEIYNIIEYEDCYRTDDLYYPKSEVDKVIAELKGYRDECERQFQVKVNQVIDLTNKLDNRDIQIRHNKYKRCLAMSEMCNARYDEEDAKVNGCGASWEYINKEMKYWERWRWRWDALAEKFKERKNAED